MSVVNFNSTEVDALDDLPTPNFDTSTTYGRVRLMEFHITAGSAGDANSTFNFLKMPSGKVTIVGGLSQIKVSAFGTGRTLDVGISAYRAPLASSDTSADEDAIHSAAAVSSATSFAPNDELADGCLTITSVNGFYITGKCKSGSVPNGATLKGYFAVVVD